jgi:hypothetical protein
MLSVAGQVSSVLLGGALQRVLGVLVELARDVVAQFDEEAEVAAELLGNVGVRLRARSGGLARIEAEDVGEGRSLDVIWVAGFGARAGASTFSGFPLVTGILPLAGVSPLLAVAALASSRTSSSEKAIGFARLSGSRGSCSEVRRGRAPCRPIDRGVRLGRRGPAFRRRNRRLGRWRNRGNLGGGGLGRGGRRGLRWAPLPWPARVPWPAGSPWRAASPWRASASRRGRFGGGLGNRGTCLVGSGLLLHGRGGRLLGEAARLDRTGGFLRRPWRGIRVC